MERVDVRMPHLGVSVTEGTVLGWRVAPGTLVEAEQPVCDVATDKVDTEVLAPVAGRLEEVLAAEGDTVAVGAALGVLVAAHAPQAARVPQAEPPRAVPAPARRFDHAAALDAMASRPRRDGRPLASPVARRIAREHGVDLASVPGTGAHGRIRKADVLAASRATAPASGGDVPPGYGDVPYEVRATTHVRRVTADNLIRSRRTAAHMTTNVDVDLQRLTEIRAAMNEERIASGRPKLSYLPFLARAATTMLREFPVLNATFERERMLLWREINLGVAVDTPHGLLVPVVRRAEDLTVDALARRIGELAAGARDRTLPADAYAGGTFTISNPGSVGAVSAMAIINLPQVAVLGVPAIVRRPWVVSLPDGTEAIAVRPILGLALTYDHRAVDGAEATRGLVRMKALLETAGDDDLR